MPQKEQATLAFKITKNWSKIAVHQPNFFQENHRLVIQDSRAVNREMLGLGVCNVCIALYLITSLIDMERPVDSIVSNAPWLLIPYMLLRKGMNQIFQSLEIPQIVTVTEEIRGPS